MPDTFIEGFAYDRWADARWCDHARSLPPQPTVTSLLSHLGATKQVWLRRLRGTCDGTVPIWPDESLADAVARVHTAGDDMADYVQSLRTDELSAGLTYENSSGTRFTTPVRDILMHVLTHGHYHRGQLAQHVRRAGHDTIWTDYIAFSREKTA